jgi:quinol monooxygenase YgiN
MIHVLATVELASGQRETFLTEFRRVMPLVRAEDGCLEYGATVDLPTGIAAQGPVRPDVVVIVERWRDLAALQAHLVAPHMTEYRVRVKPLVVRTQLQVLEPA